MRRIHEPPVMPDDLLRRVCQRAREEVRRRHQCGSCESAIGHEQRRAVHRARRGIVRGGRTICDSRIRIVCSRVRRRSKPIVQKGVAQQIRLREQRRRAQPSRTDPASRRRGSIPAEEETHKQSTDRFPTNIGPLSDRCHEFLSRLFTL